MTYLRRAFKYLIQCCLIFVLIIGALMLTGFVSSDVSQAFQDGWTSIGYILALFAVMSLAYPHFGYGKRIVRTQGDPREYWESVESALQARGYRQTGETPEGGRQYSLVSAFARAMRLWEDCVTIQPVPEGFQAEGLVRDLSRVLMSINHKLHQHDN